MLVNDRDTLLRFNKRWTPGGPCECEYHPAVHTISAQSHWIFSFFEKAQRTLDARRTIFVLCFSHSNTPYTEHTARTEQKSMHAIVPMSRLALILVPERSLPHSLLMVSPLVSSSRTWGHCTNSTSRFSSDFQVFLGSQPIHDTMVNFTDAVFDTSERIMQLSKHMRPCNIPAKKKCNTMRVHLQLTTCWNPNFCVFLYTSQLPRCSCQSFLPWTELCQKQNSNVRTKMVQIFLRWWSKRFTEIFCKMGKYSENLFSANNAMIKNLNLCWKSKQMG